MRIVGIALVRNEDLFIERVLRNVVEFCDAVLVADHGSEDGTWPIAQQLAREFPRVECRRIRHPRESHEMIRGYAGTDTWIFGVDGDELYDPGGLRRFRKELLEGRYQRWWRIIGNVLHCESIDVRTNSATGYLAPPARSMTKMFNFSAISAWDGDCVERLHGGRLVFRPGYEEALHHRLHEQVTWETSPFRCLHACFLRRSSLEPGEGRERKNIMEQVAEGVWGKLGLGWLVPVFRGQGPSWKRQKYMRGDRVTVDASPFLGGARGGRG